MGTPSAPSASPSGRYRWLICALLFWVTTANYIDRGVFSNLAPELQKQFHWTDAQFWYMGVAFNIAYALSQLVMGRMIDKLGLRLGFALACGFWGLASVSHAFVTGITGFFVVRILLGFGEGGNFPAAIKTTAEWFPKNERSLATGIFNSGSNVGGILVPIALSALIPVLNGVHLFGHVVGWRGAFLITGGIDLLWIIAWATIYRKPNEHPKLSAEELAYINSEPPEPSVKIPWSELFKHRQAWAFTVAKFMTDGYWWFYLVGSPIFLARQFNLDLKARGTMIGTIYVVASIGSIAGGWLAGHFMKKGWTTNRARKTTMGIAAVCVIPVCYAAVTSNAWFAVALITLAASAHQAWSANAFSLASDMFPRRMVGSVTGLGGLAGATGGILLFLIIAQIQKAKDGNYTPIFIAASVSYVIGLGIIHLLAPKMERAQIDEKSLA